MALQLATRTVEDHEPLCPAGTPVGETIAGSGVLCRVLGNLVTTGENPSSILKFCCNQWPDSGAADADGNEVRHGYQNCPAWRFNRKRELEAKRKELFVKQAST